MGDVSLHRSLYNFVLIETQNLEVTTGTISESLNLDSSEEQCNDLDKAKYRQISLRPQQQVEQVEVTEQKVEQVEQVEAVKQVKVAQQ